MTPRPVDNPRSPWRRVTTFTLLIAAMLAVSAAGLGGEPEYRVKGVFLYRMAHFLQWPESNLPPKAKTIVIGVVGKDPFGKELDLLEQLKPVDGRDVVTKRFKTAAEVKGVQILFLSSSLTDAEQAEIFGRATKEGFVTVGEQKKFADRGGMFNLLIEDKKLAFEANSEAAKAAKIKVSSQLLKLAKRVVTKDD